jgi:hypothetical protein
VYLTGISPNVFKVKEANTGITMGRTNENDWKGRRKKGMKIYVPTFV